MREVNWKGLTLEYYLLDKCLVKVIGRPIFNTPSINDTIIISKKCYAIREVIHDFDKFKIKIDLREV